MVMASEAVGQMVRTPFGSNVHPGRTDSDNAGATWPKVTVLVITQVLWAIWLTPYGGHAMIKKLV